MSQEPGTSRRTLRALVAALLVAAAGGILARLWISWISYGTNDAVTFWVFALRISEHGLAWAYANIPLLNHPPLPSYWAALAAVLTPIGAEERFPFIFRLPTIAADGVTCWILWRIGLARRGPLLGAGLAAGFAWSPVALLIAGYHCNTDSIYAMLCLLAVYLMGTVEGSRAAADQATWGRATQVRFLLAGLALGAAINVKLIPVLLVAPLLVSCPTWRLAGAFVLGLTAALLPLAISALFVGDDFLRNVIGYRPLPNRWGFALLVLEARDDAALRTPAIAFWAVYSRVATPLILLLGVVLGREYRRGRMRSRAMLCALCLAAFLVLAPGFGLQYLVVLAPLLFAVDWRFALVYGALAGALAFLAYLSFGHPYIASDPLFVQDVALPTRASLREALAQGMLYSDFLRILPMPAAVVGVVTWTLLTAWALRQGFRGRKERPGPPAPGPENGHAGPAV